MLLFRLIILSITIAYGSTLEIDYQESAEKAYLYEIIGHKTNLVDSACQVDSRFVFMRKFKTGFYYLEINNKKFKIILSRNENDVKFKFKKNNLIPLESVNNKVYKNYIKTLGKFQRIRRAIYRKIEDTENENERMELSNSIDILSEKYNKTLKSKIDKYKGRFISNYLMVVYVIRTKGFEGVLNSEILKYTPLFRTDVFNKIIFKKLTELEDKDLTGEMKTNIDMILINARDYEKFYRYTLKFLLDLFNSKGPKVLYNYLIENYLINNCNAFLNEKDLMNYKKLTAVSEGKVVKNLKFMKDKSELRFSDLLNSNDYLLLFFKSSKCSYCQKAGKLLCKNVEKFVVTKVEIMEIYQNKSGITKEKDSNFLKIFDRKINDYFVISQTPTFVLLDNNLKIIVRTSDIQKLFSLFEI